MLNIQRTTLLATVCNTLPVAVPYALWLAHQDQQYLIDLSDVLGQPGDAGLTGLAIQGGMIYVAVQSSKAPRILILDRHLVPVGTIVSPLFSDLHSLHAAGDSLIAVSTGLNSIVRVDARTHEISGVFTSNVGIHVNSVSHNPSGLLICCHSLAPLVVGARRGGVFNVTTQTIVLDGLADPHSILSTGSNLLVLDSGNERLVAAAEDGTVRHVPLVGFLRGSVIADRSLFVAGCPGRVVSRKTRAATTPRAFSAAMDERNLIHEVDLDTLRVRCTISPLIAGYEIYELATMGGDDDLDPAPNRLLVPDSNTITRAFYEAAKRAHQNLAAGMNQKNQPAPG